MKFAHLMLAVFLTAGLTVHNSHAACLSPSPTLDPAGAENLNTFILGAPIEGAVPLWPITLLDWKKTGQVTIEVDVLTDGCSTSEPKQYLIFLTAQNNTPDLWTGFDLNLSGPATFSVTTPAELSITSASPTEITPSEISFSGLAWDQASFGPRTFSFAIDVSAPISNDPVRLTLNPIATVPEPASGAVIAFGLFAIGCTRRRK